jgi:hypothetical protein
MYGNGKYALFTTEAALVIVAVSAVLVVVVVLPVTVAPPSTAPVAVAMFTVPVHVAPVGQQATFFARSVVHIDPEVQHAPAYAAESVEQEL